MGCFFSKKSTSFTPPTALQNPPDPPEKTKSKNPVKKKAIEATRKEIFVIKHRTSHEIDRSSEQEKGIGGLSNGKSTSSKEEIESILMQCGRLSRNSSGRKVTPLDSAGSSNNTRNLERDRRYFGSKRSYDFDNEVRDKDREMETKKGIGYSGDTDEDNVGDGDDGGGEGERINRHRHRQRHSRSSSGGRKGTPSMERDQTLPQRSNSRDRGGSDGGGRRVSQSPGRRSESPISTSSCVTGALQSSSNANGSRLRPGKMVSVPATVSSFGMDNSENGGGDGGAEPNSAAGIRRIQVIRNVGVPSPRARSPARTNVRGSNEKLYGQNQQQQPLSLSRSNSWKAEKSPYRRNPLRNIETNVGYEELSAPRNKAADKNIVAQDTRQKQNVENVCNNKVIQGAERFELQSETRNSRSRDLDTNPESLLNPTSSYTALLLEDIQKFHQKNPNVPAFSLPDCVTKAYSILEAVADMNSSTSSNLSCAVSSDKIRNPMSEQSTGNEFSTSFGANFIKKRLEDSDSFVKAETVVRGNLVEPSFHKSMTLKRGTVEAGYMEQEQDSLGSNSFVGGHQNSISSFSWGANLTNSTEQWISSRSNTREDQRSPSSFQRHAFTKPNCDKDEIPKSMSGKMRHSDHQQTKIGRGRANSSRGVHKMPPTAVASN